MKVCVLGDLLIDREFEATERMCPEIDRPITVCKNCNPSHTQPGGAGNVAAQLELIGAEVSLFTLLGQIPVKERFYDGQKLLWRRDLEVPQYGLTDEEATNEREIIREAISDQRWDMILACDYGKGLFKGEMVKGSFRGIGLDYFLRNHPETLLLVDPKVNHIWQGLKSKNTLIKPNFTEAERITNTEDYWFQVMLLLEKFKRVVVTNAGVDVHYGQFREGMHRYAPSEEVIANTVVGAGDCFLAFLAMSLVQGDDLHTAVKKAFNAGRRYVLQPRPRPIL